MEMVDESTSTEPEVVVITGASAGVGRATARAFAKRGARIGLLARGEAGLEGARRDVEEAGGEALVVPTDVSDAEQVETAAVAVEGEFGPIDVWVNDAMTSVFSPANEMEANEYERVTEVTYLGFVYGTQVVLDRMRPRDEGTIVQVGSPSGSILSVPMRLSKISLYAVDPIPSIPFGIDQARALGMANVTDHNDIGASGHRNPTCCPCRATWTARRTVRRDGAHRERAGGSDPIVA